MWQYFCWGITWCLPNQGNDKFLCSPSVSCFIWTRKFLFWKGVVVGSISNPKILGTDFATGMEYFFCQERYVFKLKRWADSDDLLNCESSYVMRVSLSLFMSKSVCLIMLQFFYSTEMLRKIAVPNWNSTAGWRISQNVLSFCIHESFKIFKAVKQCTLFVKLCFRSRRKYNAWLEPTSSQAIPRTTRWRSFVSQFFSEISVQRIQCSNTNPLWWTFIF